MRVSLSGDPFTARNRTTILWERGSWPCLWIALPEAKAPYCCAFRRLFSLEQETVLRVHVSADERYELFLDGQRIGLGPERGAPEYWFFETYDLLLTTGEHSLVARVTALGELSPFAQMSVDHGFVLAADEDRWGELLSTGVAEWEVKQLGGYGFEPKRGFAVGANLVLDGARFDWDFQTGGGNGWQPAESKRKPICGDWFPTDIFPGSHLMQPAPLPPMMDEERAVGVARFVAQDQVPPTRVTMAEHLAAEAPSWTALLQQGTPLEVPPHTTRRIVIDLENYYCAYPQLVTSKGRGSRVEIAWAEALYLDETSQEKGNRNEIDGRFFREGGDLFLPDGGLSRTFDTLWWRAGRYVQVRVQTADEPLVMERLLWRETRYPLEMESTFAASDQRLARVIPVALRCLQMDAHETYMDCPYYEQLMYIGDTRIEILTTYVVTQDARLPRKAMQLFDASRFPNGLTQSRFPSHAKQVIPPFSLWWVAMIHDFASWRDDRAFVSSMAPGARGVIDGFLRSLNADVLIEALPGWNFVDWVPEWSFGIPPEGDNGVSSVINWHFVLVLRLLAEVEDYLEERELAARWRRLATQCAARITEVFWDEARGLFADDAAHTRFSEHAQCLAILSGQINPAQQQRMAAGLLSDPQLARTTVYFTHYLFETYRVIGRIDALIERLSLWFELDRLGFKTTFERPEPSRSDCHAWGAHPIYHYFATILGIRPGSMGFQTVNIAPQLGSLTSASGKLVHPLGEIEVDLVKEGNDLHGSIKLPTGLRGTFTYAGRTVGLREGQQVV
jgi:hypothetical protein